MDAWAVPLWGIYNEYNKQFQPATHEGAFNLALISVAMKTPSTAAEVDILKIQSIDTREAGNRSLVGSG